MVQVSYPGVYVVEVPSGVHTITGVSTSIAAFLGRTSKGPMNKAVRRASSSPAIQPTRSRAQKPHEATRAPIVGALNMLTTSMRLTHCARDVSWYTRRFL